ncbi:MAG: hypothetical protein MUF46_09425 [Desulfobacterales bacterium]|nr:hypothetical protein [Desulfobacterales bacterium]
MRIPLAGAKDRFAYFIETESEPVGPGHPAWERDLPGSRQCRPCAGRPTGAIPFTVGAYFQAAREFLEAAGTIPASAPIHIFLAKHGAFYHPARVAAEISGRRVEYVLNVALSDAGRDLIHREFKTLQRLRQEFHPAWIPAVFACGEAAGAGGTPVAMFLGEWLTGFHEFHLTLRGDSGETAILLWDSDGGNRYLSREEARRIYAGAARILTHYFNLLTGECINSWHHAAGDFVANPAAEGPAVRLITVRDYRPLRRRPAAAPTVAELMESLLLFFLNLSIRMRLDRWDGVGEVAWSGPIAVEGCLDGFLEALAAKPDPPGVPVPLDLLFRHYLLSLNPGYLLEVCRGLLTLFHPAAPDLPVASARLEEHVALLTDSLGRR